MTNSRTPKKARQVRFQVELSEAIMAAIDDYRFATRAPNRAEAARRLLRAGRAAGSPRLQ